MSEVVQFPKAKITERTCVELECWNKATHFIELAEMVLGPGGVSIVPNSERIFKFFCSEHAPEAADPL